MTGRDYSGRVRPLHKHLQKDLCQNCIVHRKILLINQIIVYGFIYTAYHFSRVFLVALYQVLYRKTC